MEKTTYYIDVQVRDENGKIPMGVSVDKTTTVKKPSIQFQLSVVREEQLEAYMKQIASALRAWIPFGYEINIEAGVENTLSQTIMTMYSFYEREGRFVKHT